MPDFPARRPIRAGPRVRRPVSRMSRFEYLAGRDIDYWSRGIYFIKVWMELNLKWYGYDQFWFFRGARDYYLEYVPFFWRSEAEFEKFEQRFIKEALEARARRGIPESEFVRKARSHKARLNLELIQGFIIGGVAAKAGGAVGAAATAMDKANEAISYKDIWKCTIGDDDESCVKVIQNYAIKRFKSSHSH